MTNSSEMQEVVVISGASSGIGKATAYEMARRGFRVLAGIRRAGDADAIRGKGIEPFILDITNPDHIHALAARVDEDTYSHGVRALINNAGVGINAPVETFGLDEWRRLLDVNFFGHIAVTQKLLPALIRSKGRVVNISSVGGKIAMAAYGPYAAAKFALEAVSDSLRREIEPLGVKVIVVEPGAVTTGMLGRVGANGERIIGEMTDQQRSRYGALMHAVIAQAEASVRRGTAPEEAARVIAQAITTHRPRTRYTVGRDAAIMVRLTRLLPDRILDRLLIAALRQHLPKDTRG